MHHGSQMGNGANIFTETFITSDEIPPDSAVSGRNVGGPCSIPQCGLSAKVSLIGAEVRLNC